MGLLLSLARCSDSGDEQFGPWQWAPAAAGGCHPNMQDSIGDIMWRDVLIVAGVVVVGGVLFLAASFTWRMIRAALGKKGKGKTFSTG